jgi:hypothetical protein
MEAVLKFLDDLDDLQALLHVHSRPAGVTLIVIACAGTAAAVFAFALA